MTSLSNGSRVGGIRSYNLLIPFTNDNRWKLGRNKTAAPVSRSGFEFSAVNYFFLATVLALRLSSMAACAAARRATGTRKGEQLT